MRVVKTIAEVREARRELKGSVGLVTTMGALHAGHLSLVNHARDENDAVMTTIFINPTQFVAGEDFEKYPRDYQRDLDLFEQNGVDLVFMPTPEVMYPPGYQTFVEVTEVSKGLEGAERPGHFRGVATVVSKLFNLAQADRAYFGQKDAQQVVVIRRMVGDLNIPVEVVVCPTAREPDGLAMSSRNVYLSEAQRRAATIIVQALDGAADLYERVGEREPEHLRQAMLDVIATEPLARVDYVSVADPVTLVELDEATWKPVLLSLTVRFGETRLLDNRLLPEHLNDRDGLTGTLGFIEAPSSAS